MEIFLDWNETNDLRAQNFREEYKIDLNQLFAFQD